MRILAAQINPIIGDLRGNTDLIIRYVAKGRDHHADVVIFPELALTGYPPQDLLLLPEFITSISKYLEQIIQSTKGLTSIVGMPRANLHGFEKGLYNSAAIIQNGELLGFVDKILLPTYDIFDERRYFEPGNHVSLLNIKNEKVGITICEDLWEHSGFVEPTKYRRDPILELKDLKPDLVLNLSASPYSYSKFNRRFEVCQKIAKTLGCPIILCNQVGANDSVIFDGYSLFVTPSGTQQWAKGFREDAMLIDTDASENIEAKQRNEWNDLYGALVLGVRDYFQKQGFKKACLGLSGGIDSALVACIAVEALGSANVRAMIMPSRFTSSESLRDAEQLANNLGIAYQVISIEEPFESYRKILEPHFEDLPSDITEENLQARIRGMILMAFSNKFGDIVLSTGNKSEMALGYATLYGDMCGGLGVINDVTKGQVYKLAQWINRNKEIIPSYTIERPPSAELRFDQKDTDSLPEYEIIDRVLQAYIEDHLTAQEISSQFEYSIDVVRDVIRKIHQNEYKRRQAPPGLRVSEKAFTVGRNFPIVQKWVCTRVSENR